MTPTRLAIEALQQPRTRETHALLRLVCSRLLVSRPQPFFSFPRLSGVRPAAGGPTPFSADGRWWCLNNNERVRALPPPPPTRRRRGARPSVRPSVRPSGWPSTRSSRTCARTRTRRSGCARRARARASACCGRARAATGRCRSAGPSATASTSTPRRVVQFTHHRVSRVLILRLVFA